MQAMTAVEPLSLIGRAVLDSEGEPLGQVAGVYLDRATRKPAWAAVALSPGRIAMAPLAGAGLSSGIVQLGCPAQEVKDAPGQVRKLRRELSTDDEVALYRHYGDGDDASPARAVATTATDQGRRVASRAADEAHRVASAAADRGREVATTAKEQGQEVVAAASAQTAELVDTAKERAAEVAAQASAQARDLLEETKGRVQEQATAGAQRLGEGLGRLGEEVLALTEGRPQEAPTLRPYAQRAADRLLEAADHVYAIGGDIETRGLGGLLDDMQSFARRRPAAFLLGAAAAGLVAGRAARASSTDDGAPFAAETTSEQPPPTAIRRQGTTRGGR